MKKVVIFGIIAIMLGSVYAVYAGPTLAGNSGADTQAFVGSICFQPGGYADLYVWRIDQVGNAYQVTGHNPVYPSAMNGGGAIVNGHLLLQMDETLPSLASWGDHNIDIDLATMTGTDDLRFSGLDGLVYINYLDLPLTKVPCPAPGAPAASGPALAGK